MKFTGLLLVGWLAGCHSTTASDSGSDPASEPVAPAATVATVGMGEGVNYVASANPERPRLRYRDGQLSRNESCFIKLGNKLNPKVPPLYINGNPVGFC